MDAAQAGPANSLADVRGLRVGHATLAGDGWLTGVTVVLAPPEGATGGVDVRGGGPGTRETDLLSPLNQVEKVNAIVLSGGSAYGLAAAHGVMTRLAALHRGVQVGPSRPTSCPSSRRRSSSTSAAAGSSATTPAPTPGAAAFDAALSPIPNGLAQGRHASWAPAQARSPASSRAGSAPRARCSSPGTTGAGITVAALAAVNAVGSVADHRTGLLHRRAVRPAGRVRLAGSPPSAADLRAGAAR